MARSRRALRLSRHAFAASFFIQKRRLLLGSDARRLLLAAPLFGAWLTVGADWLARSLLAPAELPVGVITSLLGAPFFLWLLRHAKDEHA